MQATTGSLGNGIQVRRAVQGVHHQQHTVDVDQRRAADHLATVNAVPERGRLQSAAGIFRHRHQLKGQALAIEKLLDSGGRCH